MPVDQPIHWPSLTDAEKAALVAEKCMGWTGERGSVPDPERTDGRNLWGLKDNLGHIRVGWLPHLDNNQSTEVVEATLAALPSSGYQIAGGTSGESDWDGWEARVYWDLDKDNDGDAHAWAPTRPEAEVLACLRARGVEVTT